MEIRLRAALVGFATIASVAAVSLQRANPPAAGAAAVQSGTTARVVAAANAFLGMLNDGERSKATFGFTSTQRTGWSNLPSGIFQRNGLRMGDLTPPQRDAAM